MRGGFSPTMVTTHKQSYSRQAKIQMQKHDKKIDIIIMIIIIIIIPILITMTTTKIVIQYK